MSLTTEQVRELLDKATPGPWEAESGHEQRNGVLYWQVQDDSDCIMQNQFCYTRGDAEANARLIAASPDLAREVLRLREALKQAYAEAAKVARDEEHRLHTAMEKAVMSDSILRLSGQADVAERIAVAIEALNGETEA